MDAETRCVHYRSALDIIAIKMACCGVYYACKDCHAALADHEIKCGHARNGASAPFSAELAETN